MYPRNPRKGGRLGNLLPNSGHEVLLTTKRTWSTADQPGRMADAPMKSNFDRGCQSYGEQPTSFGIQGRACNYLHTSNDPASSDPVSGIQRPKPSGQLPSNSSPGSMAAVEQSSIRCPAIHQKFKNENLATVFGMPRILSGISKSVLTSSGL